MGDQERLQHLLDTLFETRLEARLAQELSTDQGIASGPLGSAVTHLEIAGERLVEAYGRAILAGHLAGEISVHEPITS